MMESKFVETIHGRDLNAQEFAFIIEAMDTPNSTTKEEAEQYLTDADRRFENGKWIQDDPYVMEKMKLLSFTQAEAGKSYTYKVYEYIPNEAAGETKLIGVTYDQSEYQIRIDVKDEKNGQMYTETTVSINKGADGTILDAPEVETYDSHNPGVPTVSFENNYQPNVVTVADAPLVKTLTGMDWTAQDEFRFELTDTKRSADAAAYADYCDGSKCIGIRFWSDDIYDPGNLRIYGKRDHTGYGSKRVGGRYDHNV